MKNIDKNTVRSFDDEWTRFDQSGMTDVESLKIFKQYFSIFPWNKLPVGAEGFDMGCGTGRWARWVASRIGHLHCIDPSAALKVAQKNLVGHENVLFHCASVEASGLDLGSQDFGYSLGVLHHVPDTAAAINSCVKLLKSGAPLLLYLYYSFDNRPWWFRYLWRVSDWTRRLIFPLPSHFKILVTSVIAALVYWPLARASLVIEHLGFSVNNVPLSYYRNSSFYTMLTDARDRFGTPLEHRYTKEQIKQMMKNAGLSRISVSENSPYYKAIGYK